MPISNHTIYTGLIDFTALAHLVDDHKIKYIDVLRFYILEESLPTLQFLYRYILPIGKSLDYVYGIRYYATQCKWAAYLTELG